ncbi:hypothetical protein GOP47_0016226 [Adiantum capillus-veneris]|uniref:Transmembrane protein n=1 Tax=Adiantum capillus-veneris TaxID=13818 RepID=A0A9D4UH91_ADICA|nr:hypothetical protein GOP47_0016226 [Adiantum capillus-veneris]
MILRASHALAERASSDGYRSRLQKPKRKAKLLRLTRALPPLQQEREPVSSEAAQSVQSQLELLSKLTSGREKDGDRSTIGEQLVKKKRNIRRQKYLDQVSKRNDVPFFAAIALLVILPPAVILGVAVATGYLSFLP